MKMPPPSDPVLPWLLGRGYPKRLKDWPQPNCRTFLAKNPQFKEFIRTKLNQRLFWDLKISNKGLLWKFKNTW